MNLKRLAAVCELTMGQAPEGESYNTDQNGMPLIAGAGDFGDVHPNAKKYTTSPGKVCQPGDIILGIRASIGEKVIADREYCLGRGVAGLRAKPGLEPRFLWHWLSHQGPTLTAKARGATFKQVNREDIGELSIDLPTVAEQRRIAAILDQADALRAKRREALAKLDELTQAIFVEMFGDRSRILEKWTTKPLGDLLDFLTSGSRGWAAYYSEAGSRFLRIQNVLRDQLSLEDIAFVIAPASAEASRTRVQPGDVLLSITADLGRTAVVPDGLGEAYINQHLAILRTTAVAPRFLSAFLASPAGQLQVMGRNRQAVKAGLNFDDVRSFLVPLPPRALQAKFVQCAAHVDGMVAAQITGLERSEALFASLQHRAFRGEL